MLLMQGKGISVLESTTMWTGFCHFFTPPPPPWTVFIPWAWKNKHFLTPYGLPPHLVHVVIECPFEPKMFFFSRKDTNVLSCVIHVTAKRILERLGVQTLYCPFFCFKKQEWMQVCRYVKVCTFWFFFFAFHQYVDITQFICDRKNPKLYFKKICLNDKH